MIDALDHFVLICPDIVSGAEAYQALLGRPPDARSGADGAATAVFRTANTAVELMAPAGQGAVGDRLRDLLNAGEGPLTSLVFRTSDLEDARRVLARRGLEPGEIVDGPGHRRLRCADEKTAGVRLFILQREGDAPTVPEPPRGAASALDHLVVRTPNPDRAAALFGARLGLRLALDRTAPEWDTRFLFFRVGGLTLEIVHSLKAPGDPDAPDKIWGLTWATDDLDAAHARLAKAGRDVSEVRTGRKPGSRVFTVRDGALGAPTLFIAHAPR